ncbi:MAG: shikimate dehydrogenase [Pseudomonadota bacterium]
MTHEDVPLAGVIGDPVAHSKSPQLFAHWLAELGLLGQYVPLPVQHANFEEVVRVLPRMGFKGVNVTLPHKVDALALAEKKSDRAVMIGAANTLIFRSDGLIHADNTDGYGFLTNLREAAPDWDPKAAPAAVLGAGGAARAVIHALLDCGVPKILLTNRTRGKAQALRSDFGSRIDVVDWADAGAAVGEAGTLVNTTSLGMTGQPALQVPLNGLAPGKVVSDLVYAPLETDLLRAARAAGCTTVDGLGMLLHQAVPGFERWFGVRPEVTQATRTAVLT